MGKYDCCGLCSMFSCDCGPNDPCNRIEGISPHRTHWVHDQLRFTREDERGEEADFYTTGEHRLFLITEDGKRYEITKGLAAKWMVLLLDHIMDHPNSLWEP